VTEKDRFESPGIKSALIDEPHQPIKVFEPTNLHQEKE
jgi:hypothetical protein